MKRNTMVLILLFIFVSAAVVYFTSYNDAPYADTSTVQNSQWPADGLYFMQWNSYHGYFTSEEPYIQLSLVDVHSKTGKRTLPTFLHYYIVAADGKEIPAALNGVNEGPKEEDYSLYSIALLLPKQAAGKYIFNKLKLVDADNKEQIYNIGSWVINVRDGNPPSDISIGKRTFVGNELDWYRAEITNNTKDKVYIDSLEYELMGYPFTTTIKSSSDFNMKTGLSDTLSINPKELRTFQFGFNKAENDKTGSRFVSIRPFIHYKINNADKVSVLPTAIFSPEVNGDEILKLVLAYK